MGKLDALSEVPLYSGTLRVRALQRLYHAPLEAEGSRLGEIGFDVVQ